MIFIIGPFFFSAFGEVPATAPEAPEPVPQKIRVHLIGTPGVEYAGFLVALENGYYRRAGLPPVEILWGNHHCSSFDLLRERKAEFGVTWMAEGLVRRAEGESIVAINRTSRHSACGMMVRVDLNPMIDRLDRLRDKRLSIGYSYSVSHPLYLFQAGLADARTIFGPSKSEFLLSKRIVDGVCSTTYTGGVVSKYLSYRNSARFLRMSDIGVEFPEETVFCRETFYRSYPEICRKFIEATYRGWFESVADPEKTLALLLEKSRNAKGKADEVVLQAQFQAWKEILDLSPKLEKNGDCSENDFNHLRDALIKSGIITQEAAPSYGEFFHHILSERNNKQ